MSEDDGTRTRNHRIDSPTPTLTKLQKNKRIVAPDDAGRTAGRTRHENESEGGIPDADLTALVAAWPTLPEHIRSAIRALVGTVAPTPNPFTGPSGANFDS